MSDSRFTLLPSPPLPPARDFVTWSSEDKNGFIDTGFTVKPHEAQHTGRVYLSVATVKEMAKIAGLFEKPSEAKEAAYQQGYDEGYADGLIDNLGLAELRGIVDRLSHLVERLPDPVVPEEGPGAEGAVDGERTRWRTRRYRLWE
jgi:hypothetical protein